MLVLTRKIDEQILIGDDIKITLVRVKGNAVRIGIEAPNDVRILRGELESRDQVEVDAETSQAIDGLATVFAHPEPCIDSSPAAKSKGTKPAIEKNRVADVAVPSRVLVGRFDANGKGQLRDTAPLSGFMSAT